MGRIVTLATVGIALVAAGIVGGTPPSHEASAGRRSHDQGGQAVPTSTITVVTNVRVFDGERAIERTNVAFQDGKILAVEAGYKPPSGATLVNGAGKTLLPGLIDAHTHAFGDALERALVFGVTTEMDMFTEHRMAAALRKEQASAGGAPRRADLFSAGTLLTAPGGHGTEYGMAIPTVSGPADVDAFVEARIAEGSDYIKIVYDDGRTYGRRGTPTVSRDTLAGAIRAAKRRDKLAVVHIGSKREAEEALDAGASALIHLFADEPPDGAFVERAINAKAFIIPTLSVNESTGGVGSGTELVEDARIAPYLNPVDRVSLNRSFPKRPDARRNIEHAKAATRMLHEKGVPILAGSDAPNPGTAHGVSIHRELRLLVDSGLSPAAALAAATSAPARAFELKDRGRIAEGLRADFVLVNGDPTRDIGATRDIAVIWKGGSRFERPRGAPDTTPAAPDSLGDGAVSDFDADDTPSAKFGSGWQISTDRFMGGTSTAEMRIVKVGARNSTGALDIAGTITAGAAFTWAGAMFFPAATPMMPANLSQFKEIVFWTKGDGAEYRVMVFATKLGNIPASRPFTAGPGWQEVVMPLADFGVDGSDLRGVLFSATQPGAFRLTIDDVRFR
jgi:imidazolonepropionase-like amidohydrolase